MVNLHAELFYPAQCFLGEGPMWHSKRQSCFWTNIEGFGFYELKWNASNAKFYKTEYRVSLILETTGDDLLLGLQGGIARFDLKTETLRWLTDLEKDLTNQRCNDGAVDAHGRLWIGTMDRNFAPGAGSLYCFYSPEKVEKKLANTTISNGLCWSPDRRRLYYIDSPTQKVQAFLFEEETGNVSFEKDILRIPRQKGTPDGMAIDTEGMLWIAQWGGFGVYRYDPVSGELIGMVSLPVPNVSCCAFVGPERDHLLITTARQDLDENALKKYPQSGDVFLANPGLQGIPPTPCPW